jgi:hypothetical protein
MVVIRMLTATLLALVSLHAAEPFFAPPRVSGSITVALYPTEVVQSSSPVLVTFGVPFTRGSITAADLAKVRVLRAGQELPAHVEMLTPWRHAMNSAIDGQSVRVALVQIHYAFSARYPVAESLTVSWGVTTRGSDVANLEPPRSAWHLVTTGTFAAADSVYEPDVYAVLPKDLLCAGVLRFPRMEPFADSILPTRDDPSAMAPIQHWSGNREQMYGQKNFFYSIINEDDSRDTAICHYKTDYEPWLFDRSSSMFALYFRSAFFKPLREAVRAAGFYCNHMKATGFFDLKDGDDAKYSYNECFAYTYWLTGDDRIKGKIATATLGFNGVRTRWTPTMNFWTERHSGFKLLANTIAFEVLGGAYRDSMLAVLNDLVWLQNGAGGQVPAGRVDGGLYHYGAQHDWDWAEDTLGASPWMSMFVMDPMLRVYGLTETAEVGQFIRRMGGFFKASCIATSYNSADGKKMDFPRYAVLFDGRDGQADEWSDVQHALEVGAGVAYGYYLSILLGSPDTSLAAKAQSLYYTYDDQVNGWIRPAGPQSGLCAYRVSPWRKYNWEYRPSGGFSWAVAQSAGSAAIIGSPTEHKVSFSARPIDRGIAVDVDLPRAGPVSVALFGLNGRQLAIAPQTVCPAGRNRVVLRQADAPAGLYIVRVAAQGSKKCLMVGR